MVKPVYINLQVLRFGERKKMLSALSSSFIDDDFWLH